MVRVRIWLGYACNTLKCNLLISDVCGERLPLIPSRWRTLRSNRMSNAPGDRESLRSHPLGALNWAIPKLTVRAVLLQGRSWEGATLATHDGCRALCVEGLSGVFSWKVPTRHSFPRPPYIRWSRKPTGGLRHLLFPFSALPKTRIL